MTSSAAQMAGLRINARLLVLRSPYVRFGGFGREGRPDSCGALEMSVAIAGTRQPQTVTLALPMRLAIGYRDSPGSAGRP
jgi:hypothetical protein